MLANDQILLKIIWDSSIIMSFLSISIFALMVAVRVITDNKKKRYKKRYKEMEKMLLVHISHPLNHLGKIFTKNTDDLEILSEIAQKLLNSLKSDSWEGLYTFIEKTGLEQTIIDASKGYRLKTKIAAIRIMGYLTEEKIFSDILKEILSGDNDIRIVYACAEALARRRNIKNFDTITESLNRYDYISPLIIYDILDKFGEESFSKLKKIIESDKSNKNLKIASIYCCAMIDKKQSYDLLEILHNNPDLKISSAAYNSMARMQRGVSSRVIKYGANSNYWRIRMHTAICAKNSDVLPVDELLKLLGDSNWIVSSKAAEALLSFEHAGLRILKTVSMEDSVTGKRAALFLNENGEANAA